MLRDDFLVRMIRRLGDLIGRAIGLARGGKHDEAQEAVAEIYKSELGMPRDMLEKLDAQTVASTFGAEKSMIIAALLDAEAQLASFAGDRARATERGTRANAIRSAAGLPVT